MPDVLEILTNVQEKLVSSQANAVVPPTGGAAFPKATHRKLSKVCPNMFQQRITHAQTYLTYVCLNTHPLSFTSIHDYLEVMQCHDALCYFTYFL